MPKVDLSGFSKKTLKTRSAPMVILAPSTVDERDHVTDRSEAGRDISHTATRIQDSKTSDNAGVRAGAGAGAGAGPTAAAHEKKVPMSIPVDETRATIPSEQRGELKKSLAREIAAMIQARQKEQNRNRSLACSYMHEQTKNVGSKALPSQYFHKQDTNFDTTAMAVRHHTGSHYVMAGSKQFQKGVRVKGVVSRHSKQAAVRNGKKSKSRKQKSATSLGMLA